MVSQQSDADEITKLGDVENHLERFERNKQTQSALVFLFEPFNWTAVSQPESNLKCLFKLIMLTVSLSSSLFNFFKIYFDS